MSEHLKTLIGKLNETSRLAATRAASLSMSMGHYEIEIEHVLLAFLEQADSDWALVARHFELNLAQLDRDLRQELAGLKSGNTRMPVFSERLPKWFEHAWLIASLDAKPTHALRIRTGHCVLALLTDPELVQMAYRTSSQWQRIAVDSLKHRFHELTAGSKETSLDSVQPNALANDSRDVNERTSSVRSSTPALDQFTTNLTQLARSGKVDPVIGRDEEIRLAMDILMRRRQNNPILTGEAGVGKTAVVEGLALRVVRGAVPEVLRNVAIHTLDMGLLQAGASVKGEFEQRLKSVIDEVKKSAHPIILFIDEAHTMIGAGGQAGQNDAANLLKPALARGELRTIAATTWAEYKKYFEKDAALARRFQVVKVEEPSEEMACAMLRGMVPLMERHFNVRVFDEAIVEAVRLSHRYIPHRQLPDKAISVLDTACAKVAMGQATVPSQIESVQRRMQRLEAEQALLTQESRLGFQHAERLAQLQQSLDADCKELHALEQKWSEEQALSQQILSLRTACMSPSPATELVPTSATDGKKRKNGKANLERESNQGLRVVEQLHETEAKLKALQGESPMVAMQVDARVVADIVSSWTGIPLGKMVNDELQTVLTIESTLHARVIGQSHAITAIAQRVRTARAQLEDPNKPKGVFLLVGPSGVGKTETALAIADVLYGGEHKLVTINMSEYQEAHSVAGLKGAPPGYVGYGEGGVLTEAVRRNPYCVVLLDEVEKAHPDVMELFFQVFDKGVLEDGEGHSIDFKNTMIFLTSNVGSAQMMQACLNKDEFERPSPEQLDALIRPSLVKVFKPALLGRLSVIPYYPLSDANLEEIIRLKLKRIQTRFQHHHHAPFSYSDDVVESILHRCTEVDSGARNVDAILTGTVLPELAQHILNALVKSVQIESVHLSIHNSGTFDFHLKLKEENQQRSS